jgi:NADPH-dependent 2,4-dienoyl-CoA reductase/sulfur reductase-like enzyme
MRGLERTLSGRWSHAYRDQPPDARRARCDDEAAVRAVRARRLDPALRPTVVVADIDPNFSICGIPYWLSGEVTERRNLAHRTREDLEHGGLDLRLETTAQRIDVEKRKLIVRTAQGREEAPVEGAASATTVRMRAAAASGSHSQVHATRFRR